MSEIGRIAKEFNAVVVCDSTFATPVLCKVLRLSKKEKFHSSHSFVKQPLKTDGIDICVHSASKFLGGHSDVLAGVAICKDMRHFMQLRSRRMHTGCILGNLETFLLHRSLKTLTIRMKQSCKSAFKLATFLMKQKVKIAISLFLSVFSLCLISPKKGCR